MAFSVSPAVTVVEKDASTIVPGVATTIGAYAGSFRWGPAYEVFTVSNELELIARTGRPNDDYAVDFFTCASFLAYANSLRVARAVDSSTAKNAGSHIAAYLPNDNAYQIARENASLATNVWVAKYVGSYGNSISVSSVLGDVRSTLTGTVDVTNGNTAVVGDGTAFTTEVADGDFIVINGQKYEVDSVNNDTSLDLVVAFAGATATDVEADVVKVSKAFSRTLTGTILMTAGSVNVVGTGTEFTSEITRGDYIVYQNRRYQVAEIISDTQLTLTKTFNNPTTSGVSSAGVTMSREWEYAGAFSSAPGENEMHVVVYDRTGEITGVAGSVLENIGFMSTIPNTKSDDGTLIYYIDRLFRVSRYINHGGVAPTNLETSEDYDLVLGVDGNAVDDGDRIQAYDLFNDPDVIDISLIIAGAASSTLASYLIQNIAETRKDVVAFVSPELDDVVNNVNAVADSIEFRNELPSSSYGFMDSGWKYMYDKYNDKYRWIPLNGDTAGLTANTEFVADAWYSPAGLNRGNVKNSFKLAYNPTKPQRDDLYKNGINPVVDFPGSGTVLFGDKTLLAKPSAFDRINVRRLFIILEKTIATFAKFSMFEFNDEFTQANFVSAVSPFLRQVQGRRGITDFRVVCDSTNNTPDVVDRNEFVGDIYVKPARSINFVTLNFTAVRSGVAFEEVVGQV